ncbi:MAG: AAA family ATPase [Methanobrevibacter sp.]|nr:AAA family ATPase [Methanobrevibacter sp.]
MKNKFTLEINNFAHINKANIDIGKINVVTGENASGKSSISKLLYSILAPSCEEGENLLNEFIFIASGNVSQDLKQYSNIDENILSTSEILKDLSNNSISIDESIEKNIIEQLYKTEKIAKEKIKSKKLQHYIHDLAYLFEIFHNKNYEIRISELIFQFLMNEFGNMKEIFFKWNHSKISMYSNDNSFKINLNLPLNDLETNSLENIEKNNLPSVKGNPFINDVVYVETPYILDLAYNNHDEFSSLKNSYYTNHVINGNFLYHQKALLKKLYPTYQQKTLRNSINSELLGLFDLFSGNIKYNDDNNKFEYVNDNNKFPMAHTASGIKTIGILKMLVKNNLDTNSLIIMDEPEVHLHPEWQVKLAKLVVILSKKANIIFYINSHSPQFIEAIQAYSKYYGLEEETNFYLTERNMQNNKFDFKKIPRNNLKEIHSKLGRIYEIIDEINAENDVKDFLDEG